MAVTSKPDYGRGTRTALRCRAETIPFHRTVPRLARDPLTGLAEIGRETDGCVVRLGLGLFRPFLVTHPDHVQYVLRDGQSNYRRDGMLWKPLRRLNGDGIASDGPRWVASRQRFQPLFAAKRIDAMVDAMALTVSEGVDALEARVTCGEPLDAPTEMARIVHRVLVRLFFGDRLSLADTDKLGEAISTAFTSLGARMLLPFVPHAVPLPGDAAFRRAVRTVDGVIYPLIRQQADDPAPFDDFVAQMCQDRDENGDPLDETLIRGDLNALFVAGTETTALSMTWLWTVLAGHPEIEEKVTGEIQRVVGSARPTRAHLGELTYTRQVIQEVLRLYPTGWILPRVARERHSIDGVIIPRGATVILSPYVTQRLEQFWDHPDMFDPERFSAQQVRQRHRFAYYPFGAGGHMCLGTHLFTVESQLIVAMLLSRFRVEVTSTMPAVPLAAASLRPREPVKIVLHRR